MTLYKLVKEYLLDEIENYEGMAMYVDEIGDKLTQGLLNDGTVEHNKPATINKMRKNWEEYGAIFKYMEENREENINPFENAEVFDAEAYNIIARTILSDLQLVFDLQLVGEEKNGKTVLTEEVIKKIKQYIKNDHTDYFEY